MVMQIQLLFQMEMQVILRCEGREGLKGRLYIGPARGDWWKLQKHTRNALFQMSKDVLIL